MGICGILSHINSGNLSWWDFVAYKSWEFVVVVFCLRGILSWWDYVVVGFCRGVIMSEWESVAVGLCREKLSGGKLSGWEIVEW